MLIRDSALHRSITYLFQRRNFLVCKCYVFGTIRRECVDHIVVLGEAHLRRILKTYADYYNKIRTHRSLDKDASAFRPVQWVGNIASHAILGGLHHHYVRI